MSSMTLVFNTSSGVVAAAANAPAKLPHAAASYACSRRPSEFASRTFSCSYNGNCSEVNGI